MLEPSRMDNKLYYLNPISFRRRCSDVLCPVKSESSVNSACSKLQNLLQFDLRGTENCYQQLRESHVFLRPVELVHLPPDRFPIEWINDHTPPTNFIALCRRWTWATSSKFLPNFPYCPLRESYVECAWCYWPEQQKRGYKPVASDVLLTAPFPAKCFSKCLK